MSSAKPDPPQAANPERNEEEEEDEIDHPPGYAAYGYPKPSAEDEASLCKLCSYDLSLMCVMVSPR